MSSLLCCKVLDPGRRTLGFVANPLGQGATRVRTWSLGGLEISKTIKFKKPLEALLHLLFRVEN